MVLAPSVEDAFLFHRGTVAAQHAQGQAAEGSNELDWDCISNKLNENYCFDRVERSDIPYIRDFKEYLFQNTKSQRQLKAKFRCYVRLSHIENRFWSCVSRSISLCYPDFSSSVSNQTYYLEYVKIQQQLPEVEEAANYANCECLDNKNDIELKRGFFKEVGDFTAPANVSTWV